MNDNDASETTPAGSPDDLVWRKSTFSKDYACVGLATCQDGIAMRNTSRPAAGTLLLTREQLARLVTDIKAGELDDLT